MALRFGSQRAREPDVAARLERILEAANDGTERLRPVLIAYLVFGAYLALVVATTTDLDLLLGVTEKLPLIDIQVPLVPFYIVAPTLFAALHLQLCLEMALLGNRLGRLKRLATDATSGASWDDLRARLRTFPLNQLVVGGYAKPLMITLAILFVTIAVISPILLLLCAQMRFLAYHSLGVTWVHRGLILVDAIALYSLWPVMLGKGAYKTQETLSLYWYAAQSLFGRQHIAARWRESRTTFNTIRNTRASGRGVLGMALTIVSIFSVIIATIPQEWVENLVISTVPSSWIVVRDVPINVAPTLRLTCRFFSDASCAVNDHESSRSTFGRALRLSHQVIRPRSTQSVRMAVDLHSASAVGILAADEPIDLSGRDLRYADLSWSTSGPLRGNDQTTLEGANLRYSTVYGADFPGVALGGAVAHGAVWPGANLEMADLRGSDFRDACLFGANLTFVRAWGANLRGAFLAGATLDSAFFLGADLRAADLSGASLSRTLFTAANLSGSTLKGVAGLPLDVSTDADEGDPFGRTVDRSLDFSNLTAVELGELSEAETTSLKTRSFGIYSIETVVENFSKHIPTARSAMIRLTSGWKGGIELATKSGGHCLGQAFCRWPHMTQEYAESIGHMLGGLVMQQHENGPAWHVIGLMKTRVEPYLRLPESDSLILEAFRRGFIERVCIDYASDTTQWRVVPEASLSRSQPPVLGFNSNEDFGEVRALLTDQFPSECGLQHRRSASRSRP
jgi:uncharacterized protein YjbI with pentapeptide repeats